MGGKSIKGGVYPRHLRAKVDGKGIVQCDASGFLRKAGKLVSDVRQGNVAKKFADLTPGFGTYHPQDLVSLGPLDDPKPIRQSSPPDEPQYLTALSISDAEIKLSIQEGRPPREGY